MISYAPFYKKLDELKVTEYQLRYKHGVSSNTTHRMKHGKHISTKTIDALCSILNCEASDIIVYVKDEEVETGNNENGSVGNDDAEK